MKKSKLLLAIVLSSQLAIGPQFAVAGTIQSQIDTLKNQTTTALNGMEKKGWIFMNSEGKALHGADLIIELSQAKGDKLEFKAETPKLDNLNARLGAKFTIDKKIGNILTYRLGIYDQNFKKEVSARIIKIDPNIDAKENQARMNRTLHGMEAELIKNQKYLTQSGKTAPGFTFGFLASTLNLLVPNAEASIPRSETKLIVTGIMSALGQFAIIGSLFVIFLTFHGAAYHYINMNSAKKQFSASVAVGLIGLGVFILALIGENNEY